MDDRQQRLKKRLAMRSNQFLTNIAILAMIHINKYENSLIIQHYFNENRK